MLFRLTGRRWIPIAALLLAGGVIGCGSDADPADAAAAPAASPTEVASAVPTTEPGVDSNLPEGAEELEGRWAHFDVGSYEDDVMRTLIISTGFADL